MKENKNLGFKKQGRMRAIFVVTKPFGQRIKILKKVKCDVPTEGQSNRLMDGRTKRGVESPCTRLKINFDVFALFDCK